MVRQKSRWLLIRIEYESDVKNISEDERENHHHHHQHQQEDATAILPTDLVRTQLYHSIRYTMEDAFGIAASGITEDMQDTRLAMIKVPRDSSTLVRSAITIMTQLNNVPMVATVLSTNGSARTAKLATIRELKRMFQNRYAVPTQERLKKLQEHMDQVVCYVE